MQLGILSDTHGDTRMASHALLALRQRGAGFIVHCGDVGSVKVLEFMAKSPAAFVFGHDDYRNPTPLAMAAERLGIRCFGDFGEFEMGGLKFAVIHGDDKARLAATVAAQQYDYALHGHTHLWRDDPANRTRIINPGALSRASEMTCAMLHLPERRLEKIQLS